MMITDNLLDIKTIYCEPNSKNSQVAQHIFNKFPEAEVKEVQSHWKIPDLHLNEDLVDRYVRVKKNYLVLGEKKGTYFRENGRSTDYIGMSHSSGCVAACGYCLPEGTLITSPNGKVPIEQIQESDLVLSYNSSEEQLEISQVSQLSCREVDEIYEIQVGQKILRLTSEHPVYTSRGWVKAEDLTLDDEVLNVCDD